MPSAKQKNLPFRFSRLLWHPLIISLVVSTLVYLAIPVNIPKYQLTVTESLRNDNRNIYVFEDLENDSIADHIILSHNSLGNATVGLYFKPSGRVKEWDLRGRWAEAFINDFFLIGEPEPGKGKKIFAFTQSNDSLFLNEISDFSDRLPSRKEKFIATVRNINDTSDVQIVSPRLEDLENDHEAELVFGISAGFSIRPRCIFVYKVGKDTLLKSIETGNYLWGFITADINGDLKKEIITYGYAPKNILDSTVTYHDSSNWAMVFDHRLKLLFPPCEFPGRTGDIFTYVLPGPASHQKLFVVWNYPVRQHNGLRIYRIGDSGKSHLVKVFTEFDREQFLDGPNPVIYHGDYRLLVPMRNGDFYLFDTTLRDYNLISSHQQMSAFQMMDVDLDGRQEYLAPDLVMNTLTIFRDDFRHQAEINIEFDGYSRTSFSLKKVPHEPPLICINSGKLHYLLSYRENPYWSVRRGVWAGLWLLFYLFTLVIMKIQKIQMEKQIATEKKITGLQMRIVRNQMDPHFTMNAVNAVVDAIDREEKEQARESLLHFSKMYRSLVLSADQIKRTLKEELEFTENYLALERFRFGNRFSYEIVIDPDVDTGWEVPKMVIQSPVENAVKHGLKKWDMRDGMLDAGCWKVEEGGRIIIHARKENHTFVLEIADNGIGRQAAAGIGSSGTGKGTEIMGQFFELYRKITGIRVHSEITDLKDENGNPAGTRVMIIIPLG